MKKELSLLLTLAFASFTHLAAQVPAKFIDDDTLQKVKAELLQKNGEAQAFRVERALKMAR